MRPDRRDDLLGARHLRHASSRTKLTASTRGSPAAASRLDELGPHRRRERLRLVLEPVARADVADQRRVRWTRVTRSGVIRTITRSFACSGVMS